MPRGWIVTGLLLVLAMINVADKAILGLAALPQTGALLSSAPSPASGFDAALRLCGLILVAGGLVGALAIRSEPQGATQPLVPGLSPS